jgi:hypothetical protein
MQHELLHHFFTVLGNNMDTGLTRAVLLPCILKIKQLIQTISHLDEPLTFTYHDVMIMLRDAEITRYTPGRGIGPPTQKFTPIPGILDPVNTAAPRQHCFLIQRAMADPFDAIFAWLFWFLWTQRPMVSVPTSG